MEETSSSNPKLYMATFEQKQKIIELMKNGKTNSKDYLKALLKNID